MKFHLFATTVLLSLLWTSVSGFPRFFPNITAIPPAILPNNTSNAWQSFQNFAGCHKGDRVDDLGSLKQYLHRFGYIPDSPPSNFTDDFDDTLESAIRKYQLNFNLNTTGALDDRTLQQLVRPRCGVADIINGTSSMNSGKAASSTHSFHTVGHYSFFPSKPMWPSSRWDLTYAFYPGNQLTDSVKAVFSRAFDQWSAVTPLTFTETESYSDANIRIGFFTGDHGDGEPFDGVLGTLAHAFSPTDGRFHLDGDENWVLDGDLSSSSSSSASVIDLESVAVHEIGHLLGLGHSSVEEAIMYPTITSGTRKIELTEDDIEGIQVLYGSNPSYNGSSTTSTTATTGDSDTSAAGLRVVGRCWGMTFVMTAVGSMLFLM